MFKSSRFSAIFTVFILIIFQYSFYLLGKNYLYTIVGLNPCNLNHIEQYRLIQKDIFNKEFKDDRELLDHLFIKYVDEIKYLKFKLNDKNLCAEYNSVYNEKSGMCEFSIPNCHFLPKDNHRYGIGKIETQQLLINSI